MKKRAGFVFIIFFLCLGYASFLYVFDKTEVIGEAPVINVPTDVLKISVDDKKNELLKGVSASDKEDGNLTKNIFIENISEFDDQQRRTVTYAVFDSDDHLTRATRQIEYSDYKAPIINLKKALCFYYLNSDEEYKDFVSAESSVDGNISSQVSIDKIYYDDNNDTHVRYSVTDSCGVKDILNLDVTYLNFEPTLDIELNEYLIRVKKGTQILPRKYIENIKDLGIKNNSLKSAVTITDNYNPDKEGTYEFIYRINRSNGDSGMTKLVVIVE